MDFGQALVALLSNRNITCAELGRPGAYLRMQPPAGNITEPFIAIHLPNGVCGAWSPTHAAILATNWSVASDSERAVTQENLQAEHVGAAGHRG